MSGLIIRLAPNERILLNGAVVENGDRRARLTIKTPNANVLRLRDAIHPEHANTPVKRTIYLAQLIISGDGNPKDIKMPLMRAIEQIKQIFEDEESRRILGMASESVQSNQYYLALKFLRQLIAREEQLVSSASS